MQWTLFATLADNILPPFTGQLDGMIRVLQAWIGPVMRDAVLVFLVLKLLGGAIRRNIEPISEIQATAILGMVAISLASTAAGYGPYARDIALNGLSRELGNLLAGVSGSRAITGAMFDELWNKAYVAGLAVYANLPWSVAGLGLMAVVWLYWAASIAAIMLAFAVWMKAQIFIALLVGLGPLFIGLWIFPLTRAWFFGWLNTTMASVILQVLIVALLSLSLGATTRLLAQLAATTGPGSFNRANEIVQLQMLFGGMALFGFCGWLAVQLPGVAASLTHGFTGFGHVPTIPLGRGGERADPPRTDPPAPASSPNRSVPAGSPNLPPPPIVRPPPPGPSMSGNGAPPPSRG